MHKLSNRLYPCDFCFTNVYTEYRGQRWKLGVVVLCRWFCTRLSWKSAIVIAQKYKSTHPHLNKTHHRSSLRAHRQSMVWLVALFLPPKLPPGTISQNMATTRQRVDENASPQLRQFKQLAKIWRHLAAELQDVATVRSGCVWELCRLYSRCFGALISCFVFYSSLFANLSLR